MDTSLTFDVGKPGYTLSLHRLCCRFFSLNYKMGFKAHLSAVHPCKCESGVKRRGCSNTEENVPAFFPNYARL